MSERREYWVSAGMAFRNPVEGGIHVREVLSPEDDPTDEYARMYCKLHAEHLKLTNRQDISVDEAYRAGQRHAFLLSTTLWSVVYALLYVMGASLG